MICCELEHAAVTWLEAWHDGIEEANTCLSAGNESISERERQQHAIAVLTPLFKLLMVAPNLDMDTLSEVSFSVLFRRTLLEAYFHFDKYKSYEDNGQFACGWKICERVYFQIHKQLEQFILKGKVKLSQLSLKLSKVPESGFSLAVPGGSSFWLN